MKKAFLKVLAVLLIFSMCVPLLPTAVFAVTEEPTENTTPTIADFIAGTATAADIYGALDKSTVPAIIGYEEAVAKNHIARLYDEEGTNLNTVIFLNVDGTKTVYTYDFPVKYVDENGDIRDISLAIADDSVNTGGFETAANSTVTKFSTNFTDGIALRGNNASIRLVPVLPSVNSGTATMFAATAISNAAEAQRVDENTVAYSYDAKTVVEYSLTYTGFKEDIVVSEYTGQTTYPFRLYTNGLALEELDGSFYLVDDDGNVKATIGDIIIFTADERNNAFGDIEPRTIVEKQEYLLNIVVDADYLADPETVYPIRIDPTVEINYDSGSSAIEDITISTNTNFSGSHGSLYVGRRSTEGIARVLMRFPGLNVSDLAGATITSASVQLRDLMCESNTLDVSCHVFTGNVWNASSATWANVSPDSYVSTALSTRSVSWSIGNAASSKYWYSFDITSAVQGWVDGNLNQNKGIIFKVSSAVEYGSTVNNRTFASFNRSSYKPTLSVTYNPADNQFVANDTYYINNQGTGKYLMLSPGGNTTSVSGLLSTFGDYIRWQVQKVGDGYTIRAVNDPTKYLAGAYAASSTNVGVITVSDSSIPTNCMWTITAYSNTGCMIRNMASGNYLYSDGTAVSAVPGTGDVIYRNFAWRLASTSTYGNTSAYAQREVENGFAVNDMIVNVGQTQALVFTNMVSNALWADASDFVITYSSGTSNSVVVSQPNNSFTGQIEGTAVYKAMHKVTGWSVNFVVNTQALLIYQTKATYYYDEYGDYAADLVCGDMDMEALRALDWVNWTDFLGYSPEYYRTAWEDMVTNVFFTGILETVVLDMIDHFMSGTGEAYSNTTLTSAILAHNETISYTSNVQSCVQDLLNEKDGDISALLYTAADRNNSLLRNMMEDRGINSPVYNGTGDTFEGLRICVDSLWGVKIEAIEYIRSGSTYTCKLRYTFYDHFGLDVPDVEKFGPWAGFRAWFILQHYSEYMQAYKPFLTLMEFEKTVTGTIS